MRYKSMVNRFKKEYLIPGIRKLSFLFNISSTDLYDTIHAYEFTEDEMIESIPADFPSEILSTRHYYRDSEVNKSNKRLKRMLSHLTLSGNLDNDDFNVFGEKIYDSDLLRCMIIVYNEMADIFNYPKVQKGVRPYRDERAFNYIEYVFLSCLMCAVRSQSIKVLNRAVKTTDQKRNANRRYADYYDALKSKRLYGLFIDVAMSSVLAQVQHDYEQAYYEIFKNFYSNEDQRKKANEKGTFAEMKKYIDSIVNQYIGNADEKNRYRDNTPLYNFSCCHKLT